MAMDNCWFGTVKQWIGVLSAPFFVHRLADAIWVPGERQSQFASKLQFRQSAILHGLYSGDSSAFAATYEARVHQKQPVKRVFVFVGRMVEVKGIPTLIAAYRLYRSRTQNPWPLVCYGQGPLASMLRAEQGIVVEGFVQPEDLPVKLANAACLVLPSSFEPWAVVINEATAAGMLVLASGVVGAVPHLVQNNYNGFIFDVGDADGLAWLMNRVSRMDDQKLNLMAAASSLLAKQFTPARWADTLLNFMETNAENCRPIARIAG
jgi:glycosyltransferase involved in cell wall biosynthesis